MNAVFVCPGLFTECALNPWIIIILFFLSLSPSHRVTFQHLLQPRYLLRKTRIHCSFNNYFYLTPGQRTSISHDSQQMLNASADGRLKTWQTTRGAVWRPFGCSPKRFNERYNEHFHFGLTLDRKNVPFSVQCVCCFLWRMVVVWGGYTKEKSTWCVLRRRTLWLLSGDRHTGVVCYIR